MIKVMSVHSEKAQRIIEYLKKELQVPDGAINFSVHFKTGEFVKVDCSYCPIDEGVIDGQ
jgi:uncharacterized FlaG/YvyC family protein